MTPSGSRLARAARDRLRVAAGLAGPDGTVDLSDVRTARTVAHRLTLAGTRSAGGPVNAGGIMAFGLLDLVARLVIERYRETVDPAILDRAATAVEGRLGGSTMTAAVRAYEDAFPPPVGTRPDALRELLLTWLANANPALGPIRTLVDDAPLAGSQDAHYRDVMAALEQFFAEAPPFGPDRLPLVAMLRAPALAAPDSLAEQLRYVRKHWGPVLGDSAADLLDRLLIGIGVIAEEEHALALRSAGAAGGGLGALAGLGGAGWDFDESGSAADAEPERFSADVEWMARLVLIAKSTYVWLDQLSRAYGREIRTLDAIPNEELDRLARLGMSGLWLIGLWQRSRASQEIKRRRGNVDAVASAYSLHDYEIASDLGGGWSLANLRERAWARGIRLTSDMVPNHMGIDSRWVIEHPDWFLQVPSSPFPAYTYNGPDLSSDDRVAIVLEDHYWDNSDAAVVFKRVDRQSGQERYIYHGNDGTSFPWNDTAQLDFIRADVREAVIQTILHVARQFPVIRFDAAMVLAKRHIQRLWYPLPGHGGAIPSRAEHAMSKRAFDAAMPNEFWREVVDRVAVEAPGTLLLAEAFWLMEGYFVRTLGMHRVYNSAFMNLLRDEDNATYRRVMRETLEFDPEILKRFVNFMSNPDEKTAVEQFGSGDKYFGVATLMATMPGLPMFGHGQLEGFTEQYGMEFQRAMRVEAVDEGLLAHHERAIAPLLQRRAWFAEVRDFLLYDVVGDHGEQREDVFAYSNVGPGGERSLIVYHNRFADTSGWIRESVPFSVRAEGSAERVQRRGAIAEGLRLSRDGDVFVVFRDWRSGLEFVRPSAELAERGFRVDLHAYECLVLLDWREVRDEDGRWARLASWLGGRGVPSIDDALAELVLEPVRTPFAELVSVAGAQRLAAAVGTRSATTAALGTIEAAARRLGAAAAAFGAADGPTTPVDAFVADLLRGARSAVRLAGLPGERPGNDAASLGFLLAWLAARGLGGDERVPDRGPRARARFDAWRLGPIVAGTMTALGLDGRAAGRAVDALRALVELPPWPIRRSPVAAAAAAIARSWLGNDAGRGVLRVHEWDGATWFDGDAWAELVERSLQVERIRLDEHGKATAAGIRTAARIAAELRTLGVRSGYRADGLAELVAERPAAPARSTRASAPAGPGRKQLGRRGARADGAVTRQTRGGGGSASAENRGR